MNPMKSLMERADVRVTTEDSEEVKLHFGRERAIADCSHGVFEKGDCS